jgi:hypothetical protein
VSSVPTQAFCNISAEVICQDEDGEDCDFTNPIGQQCMGSNADELRFIYLASTYCPGNNTQNGFTCVDGNTERGPTAYIRFYMAGETFYEGIINSGNLISVPIPTSINDFMIDISALGENNGAGTLLQSMMMSSQCREQDGLSLYDTFGSLQLVGYRNLEEGLKSIFTTATIRYTATNTGPQDATLTGAFKTNPISGMTPLIPEGESVRLSPGASAIFSDVFTLNTGTLIGMPLDFSLLVQGVDSSVGNECEASDTYTLLVQP